MSTSVTVLASEKNKPDDQKVTGVTKWSFVILMMTLTTVCCGLIIENFHKVIITEKFNMDEFNNYMDSIKRATIYKAASDTTIKDADALRKIIQDSASYISPASIKNYMANYKTGNKNEDEFQYALMLLVACTGALGSLIFILSSFVNFWGAQKLERSWLAWYAAKPFVGMGLSLLSYLALRAGFLSSNVGANDINVYGVLAISGMVGLFTDDATLKLKEIFEVIFKPKDERKGGLENTKPKPVDSGNNNPPPAPTTPPDPQSPDTPNSPVIPPDDDSNSATPGLEAD